MKSMAKLPESGFVRLAAVIAPYGPIPVSRSTWFQWIREGKAPKPVMLSARVSAYRVSDIHALIAKLDAMEG